MCTLPDYEMDRESSYHFYPIFFKNRDKVFKQLIAANIYPGMHYKRNDEYPLFSEYKKLSVEDLNGVKLYTNRELTLPFHLHLENTDIERIVGVLKSFFSHS